ncbi:hypothetical protein V8E53_006758 [Lactarius tabidus]
MLKRSWRAARCLTLLAWAGGIACCPHREQQSRPLNRSGEFELGLVLLTYHPEPSCPKVERMADQEEEVPEFTSRATKSPKYQNDMALEKESAGGQTSLVTVLAEGYNKEELEQVPMVDPYTEVFTLSRTIDATLHFTQTRLATTTTTTAATQPTRLGRWRQQRPWREGVTAHLALYPFTTRTPTFKLINLANLSTQRRWLCEVSVETVGISVNLGPDSS